MKLKKRIQHNNNTTEIWEHHNKDIRIDYNKTVINVNVNTGANCNIVKGWEVIVQHDNGNFGIGSSTVKHEALIQAMTRASLITTNHVGEKRKIYIGKDEQKKIAIENLIKKSENRKNYKKLCEISSYVYEGQKISDDYIQIIVNEKNIKKI